MSNASANLNIMVKAARIAGRKLLRDFNEDENLQVSSKGPGEFVSKADTMSEEVIREQLTEARPNYGFLAEESDEIFGEDPTRRWIVDPLDGTSNFLHGMPHWAVSIALEHRGEIVAAVVYDPIKDELFTAEKGEGAWVNGRRMRVSGRHEMIEMVFATSVPFGGRSDLPETLQDFARIMPQCAGVRGLGAVALDLAYLAAGRYDGFWERRMHPWDMAAGILLVKESGGIIEAMDPSVSPLVSGDVVASNEPIFNRFAKIVRNEA